MPAEIHYAQIAGLMPCDERSVQETVDCGAPAWASQSTPSRRSARMTDPTQNRTAADSPLHGAPFLAADVGGTHARLALVRRSADGDIEVLAHHVYQGGAFASFEAIVADFVARHAQPAPRDIVIATTGVVRGDTVINNNLPWTLSGAALRAQGFAEVALVNDFAAAANAGQCLRRERCRSLGGFDGDAEPGPSLVVGPGTGLGSALRAPCRGEVLVLPGEAGQMSFAPGTPREVALLQAWMADTSYVSCEQVISGPGLLKTYATLCRIDGAEARRQTPAEVVEAARRGDDAHALEAVRIFCAVLGGVLADLVMAHGATSVFVAGGMAPRLLDFFPQSDFHARFLDKGVMREVLERVPVRLVEDPHQGVIGAASWHLQRLANT